MKLIHALVAVVIACLVAPLVAGGLAVLAQAAPPGMLTDASNASHPAAQNNIGVTATAATTQLDKTTSTALSTVTGLTTATLPAGTTWACHGHLSGTAGASGGGQVAVGAGGSGLTATNSSFTAKNWNGTTINAVSTTTTLGNAIGAATAVFTDIDIDGTIKVGVAGTLSVQFAQNASNATTSSVYVNSNFSCWRV